jgi:putative MATE family efflux protein
MSGKYVQDMTEGNVVSLLVKFSIPMLIGNVFQQFYNMVDSIVVGRFVSANALGSVGVTGSLNFLMFSLCLGMSVGVGILISQYFGAKNDDHVKKTIANAIYIIAFTGIIMSIIGVVFARPVLQLLNTPKELLDDAVLYMQIVCGGTIAVAAYNGVSAILRALGDSKTPLIFLIVASIINVVLDLVFVIIFDLGVMGVGIATIISQGISAIGCILFAIRKNPYFKIEAEHRQVDWEIIRKCSIIGIPVAAQNAMIALSCVILQGVVNGFGPVVVAAFTATNRIEQLVQQPFNSLAAALSTFAGQNMGAGKLERVKQGFNKSVIIVIAFSLITLIAAQFGARYIMELFVKGEEEVIVLGAKAMKITSCFYFALGMIYVVRGLLNGAGDAMYSMLNGVMEVAGRVGFSKVLVMIPAIGLWGIWYTTGLTWFITGLASYIRYRQGKWINKSLVKNKEMIS